MSFIVQKEENRISILRDGRKITQTLERIEGENPPSFSSSVSNQFTSREVFPKAFSPRFDIGKRLEISRDFSGSGAH